MIAPSHQIQFRALRLVHVLDLLMPSMHEGLQRCAFRGWVS